MSKYTSTKAGFQSAMEMALSGPGDAKAYAEATATSDFYQVVNGTRTDYKVYLEPLEKWRERVEDYRPEVKEFLRDGDLLSAHMTGTIKLDGTPTVFESFMFAKVDKESGKMEWMIERAIWGAADAEMD